jgi:hypothetical protein
MARNPARRLLRGCNWPLAVQRLPQRRAKRELVDPRIEVFAARLLRRHVRRRADHVLDRTVVRSREPEVGDPRAPVVADQHVIGLEVAVDDAGGVCRGETFADREIDLDDIGDRALLDRPLARVRAGDVLHRDVHPAIELADLIDDHDIRMREPRERDRLARGECECGRRPLLDDLERNAPLEPTIPCQVDHAHRTGADHVVDLVLLVDHRAPRE